MRPETPALLCINKRKLFALIVFHTVTPKALVLSQVPFACFLDNRLNLCSAWNHFACAAPSFDLDDISVDDVRELTRLTLEQPSLSSGIGLFRPDIHWVDQRPKQYE